jgi:hypothetical protein
MTVRDVIIDHPVVFDLLTAAGSHPVAVCMRYDTADPYAVALVFQVQNSQPVEWFLARDLLDTGMRQDSGEMDVRIEPLGSTIRIILSAPSGRAVFDASRSDLELFLAETFGLVPLGAEQIDIDSEILKLVH